MQHNSCNYNIVCFVSFVAMSHSIYTLEVFTKWINEIYRTIFIQLGKIEVRPGKLASCLYASKLIVFCFVIYSLDPPTITKSPANGLMKVRKGDSVVMSCIGEGRPKPRIKWRRLVSV